MGGARAAQLRRGGEGCPDVSGRNAALAISPTVVKHAILPLRAVLELRPARQAGQSAVTCEEVGSEEIGSVGLLSTATIVVPNR